jgi:hypothetical protein
MSLREETDTADQTRAAPNQLSRHLYLVTILSIDMILDFRATVCVPLYTSIFQCQFSDFFQKYGMNLEEEVVIFRGRVRQMRQTSFAQSQAIHRFKHKLVEGCRAERHT